MPLQKHCPGCFNDKGGLAVCPVCGYDESLPRPALFLPHGIIIGGQFRVGRVLGQPGGFGITYLGWDVHLQQRVAIKEFLPRDLVTRHPGELDVVTHTEPSRASFEFGKDQFLREARIVARLDHPNVVRVRSFFNANGTAYLVMDYYEGLSLGEYLARLRRVIEPHLAVPLIRPVLEALQYVHENGVVHRDLKPHNIYLASIGKPIVLDFGAARQAAGERVQSLSVMLTDGYAPLEQYQRRSAQGPWTDVYGAAATLYRMITGAAPPTALDRLGDDPLQRDEAWSQVPDELRPPLLRALSLTAEARFPSAASFLEALSDYRAAAPTVPAAEVPAAATPATPAPALNPNPAPSPAVAEAGSGSAPAAMPLPPTSLPDPSMLAAELPDAEAPPTRLRREFPLLPPTAPEVVAASPTATAAASSMAPVAVPGGSSWTVMALPLVLIVGPLLLIAGLAWHLIRDTSGAARPPTLATAAAASTPVPVAPSASAAVPLDTADALTGPLLLPAMVDLPGGLVRIGDDRGEASEQPAHERRVAGFAIGAEEIRVEQFAQFVAATGYRNPQWSRRICEGAGGEARSWEEPGFAQSPQRPVVCVSAVDADAYAGWLTRRSGQRYRLPTEAEWEYAARAGSSSRYDWGASFDPARATCAGCAQARTGPLPVASWPRNAFGLADMAGNVREWTCSAYAPYADARDARCADVADGDRRAVRGGSWLDHADALRPAHRLGLEPDRRDVATGFRLVREAAP